MDLGLQKGASLNLRRECELVELVQRISLVVGGSIALMPHRTVPSKSGGLHRWHLFSWSTCNCEYIVRTSLLCLLRVPPTKRSCAKCQTSCSLKCPCWSQADDTLERCSHNVCDNFVLSTDDTVSKVIQLLSLSRKQGFLINACARAESPS